MRDFVNIRGVECEVLVISNPTIGGRPCRCLVDLSLRRVFISASVRPVYRDSLLDRAEAASPSPADSLAPLVGSVA